MFYLVRRQFRTRLPENKAPYYKGLEAADDAWDERRIDLTAMKDLLSSMLAKQLYEVHAQAQSGGE
jgi:hypothetical protein